MTHYQNQNFCFYKNKYKLWNSRSRFMKTSICLWDQSYMYLNQVYPSFVFRILLYKIRKIKQLPQLVNQTDKYFRERFVINFDVTNKIKKLKIYKDNFLFFYQPFEQVQQQKGTSIQKSYIVEQNATTNQIEQISSQTLFGIKFQKINAQKWTIKPSKFMGNCIISTKNYIKQPLLNSFTTPIVYPCLATVIPDSKLRISYIKTWVTKPIWKHPRAKSVYRLLIPSFSQWCKSITKHTYRHNLDFRHNLDLRVYKSLIKKNKNIPYSMLVIYLNMFSKFAQFFFKNLIRYFFDHAKSSNISIKFFIIELLIIKEKKFSFFCMFCVYPTGKHNFKNKNIAGARGQASDKKYCHWDFINPSLSFFGVDVTKERRNTIITAKYSNTVRVYFCIWHYELAFERIKKEVFDYFLLIKIHHNLTVSQQSITDSHAKRNHYHNWIINKSNLIFSNFCLVKKNYALLTFSLQIKSSKEFLFLAKLNTNAPLILTKILPILWQVNKKTQNQNTLYYIFRKYWLKLRTYYFYMKNQLKKSKNKEIQKKINTRLLFWKTLKKKYDVTLFFKNSIKTKYNINGQIKLSSFVLQLFYRQSSTINGFITKQQIQTLPTTEYIRSFFTKEIFVCNQIMNRDLFFGKKKITLIKLKYLFFYKKLKKVKNIEKTFKVFIKKSNKVRPNKVYLYTYYFNMCS